MEQVLHYMDIPPDEKTESTTTSQPVMVKTSPDEPLSNDLMPDFSNMSIREAVNLSKKHALEMDINGTGQVFKQEPPKGQKIQNKKIKLYFKT